MGKKISILLILMFLVSPLISQEVNRQGLIKGTLTLSPGLMLSNSNQPFYFHGILEGYTSAKVSLIGEGYFYLGDMNANELFGFNNSLLAGFNYHFLKDGPSDLFAGIQPGISFTTLTNQPSNERMGINPITSFSLGYNFFLNEYFHFFAMTKMIIGRHATYKVQSLNEFRISAGLGFSIPTKR